MATKAGVWIDHKQATVVLIKDAGPEIKKIAFDIGQPIRPMDGSRPKNKYTPNDFVAEDRRERKVENDRKDYYDDVIAAIRGADALVILGPGEAKGELQKHIKAKKLRGLTGFRPDVTVGTRVDQLRIDAKAIAGALHRTFHDVSDAELPADLAHVAFGAGLGWADTGVADHS